MSRQRLRLPSNPTEVKKADRKKAGVLLAELDQTNAGWAAGRDRRLMAGMKAAADAAERAVLRFDKDDARPAPKRGSEADDEAVFALLDDLEHLAALTQDYLDKNYPAVRHRLASVKVAIRRRVAESDTECMSGSWTQGQSELIAGADSTLYASLARFRRRLYKADKEMANRRQTFSASADGARRILGRRRESAHGGVLDAAIEVLLEVLAASQPRRRRTVSVLGEEERALWAMFPATADLAAVWAKLKEFLPRFRRTDLGDVRAQLRRESAAAAREFVPRWLDLTIDEQDVMEAMLRLQEHERRTQTNIARRAGLLAARQKVPGNIRRVFARLRSRGLTKRLKGEKGETIVRLPKGLPGGLRGLPAAQRIAESQ